jgi:hypothetical protein
MNRLSLRLVRQPRALLACLGVLACLLLAGCPQGPVLELTAETDDPLYRRAKEAQQVGRNEEALVSFLNLVEKRGGDAPESHLELGELYLVHVRDPIAAIYHYRKYRELKPNSSQADLVRQRIDTATREFARSLPAQPLEGQVERLELLEQIAALKRDNEALRRELENRALPMVPAEPPRQARVQQLPAADDSEAPVESDPGETALRSRAQTRTPPPQVQQERPQPGGRRYVVQRGDTLFRIAEKVYGPGQSRRWRDILAANRSVLPSESALQPGMELTIP